MKRRGNGEAAIRKRSDGRWEALLRLTDGSRKSLYAKTRPEVLKRLQEFQRDLDRGITTPKDGRQTFGEYIDTWLATKKPELEFSSWTRLEQFFRLHVKPTLGRTPLQKLTAQQLNNLYAKKLEEGQAANSVRHLHAAIHGALEDAMRLDLVARNVADLVKPPKAPHIEMEVYDPDQAMQLLEAAKGDRLEAMYVLMLTSACRLGELLGLTWDALDLERGEMQITTTLKDVASHLSFGRPKTPNSRRSIPLTPVAIASLKRHHAAQMAEKLAHGSDWNEHRLVFCTTTGNPYTRSNWRLQHYIRMINKAGLPYIHPHGLRHTAATLLLLEGVQPLVVSQMLGHGSVAFTLQTYGHVLNEMRKPARDAMERLFGGVFG